MTTRPTRENIQDINIFHSSGRGGVEVPITVMDSRTMAAVLGMTRTTRQRFDSGTVEVGGYNVSWIWSTVTPARMLMRSFPCSAPVMPGTSRTSRSMYGLQPRMTTSASLTALIFSFCNTVNGTAKPSRALWTRLTDSGRRTQAMNLFGIFCCETNSDGVVVPDSDGYAEWLFVSDREANMPDKMAIPRVPGAINGTLLEILGLFE